MLGLETQLNKTQGLPVRSSQSEGKRQGHTDGALSQGRMGWGVWYGPSVDTSVLVIQKRCTQWKCGCGWGGDWSEQGCWPEELAWRAEGGVLELTLGEESGG